MQESKARFEDEGITLVGLSYDSPQILREFAEREGISFPLLSDADSSALRSLGLMNSEATGMSEGVAFPGVIFLNKRGQIEDAIFEDSYRDRPTPGTLLARLLPQRAQAEKSPGVERAFALSQTGDKGVMGSQWELLVTFDLPSDSHLYAPNKYGYRALELEVEENPYFEIGEAIYPLSEVLEFEALNQSVPVYAGKVIVRLPVQIAANDKVKKLKTAVSTRLKGTLHYQICTDTSCLMPQEEDVEWSVVVKPLDRQRVKESNRH